MVGRQVLYKQSLPNKRFEFGGAFASGVYLVKVIQGDKSKQLRLIRK